MTRMKLAMFPTAETGLVLITTTLRSLKAAATAQNFSQELLQSMVQTLAKNAQIWVGLGLLMALKRLSFRSHGSIQIFLSSLQKMAPAITMDRQKMERSMTSKEMNTSRDTSVHVSMLIKVASISRAITYGLSWIISSGPGALKCASE